MNDFSDPQLNASTSLHVGKHQLNVFSIPLVDKSKSANAALSGCTFMLKQVIFESLTAHNFPAARFLKTLGGSFPTLKFGHSLPSVCLNLTQFMILLLQGRK